MKNCKKCKKEFNAKPWDIKRGRGIYCCKSCALSDRKIKDSTRLKLSKIQCGAKSHFWRGGTSKVNKLIRESAEYGIWRDTIFKRDNYTCQRCWDTTYVGHRIKIHPHHRIPFAKLLSFYKIDTKEKAKECPVLWDTDNGITLCVRCHSSTGNYLINHQ
jgi:hypothetical protein